MFLYACMRAREENKRRANVEISYYYELCWAELELKEAKSIHMKLNDSDTKIVRKTGIKNKY